MAEESHSKETIRGSKQKNDSNAVQNRFLDELIQSKKTVKVYMINKFQLQGKIVGYDTYMLSLVDLSGKQQTLYKTAISTIEI